MLEDMHIHLKQGVNDYDIMNNYINRCLELGLNKVVFLDHGNRISPNHKPVLYNDLVINDFFKLIDKANKKHKNITIYKGIEVDFSFDEEFRNNEIEIMKQGFDYVLGSVHSMKQLTKEQYYETILEMLEVYPINILAHLKLDENYLKYNDLINEIVKKCSDNNIMIEINTSDRSIWNIDQLEYMLKLMNKYNVTYTVGSDSHKIDELGTNYKLINEYLKKVVVC